jgi:hypothetical protein
LSLGFRSLTWPRYPARSHFGFRSRHPSVPCHCPARPNSPPRPLQSHISRHRHTLHTHAFSARLRARKRRSCETDLPPRGDHWSRRSCAWSARQHPPRMRHWLNGCEQPFASGAHHPRARPAAGFEHEHVNRACLRRPVVDQRTCRGEPLHGSGHCSAVTLSQPLYSQLVCCPASSETSRANKTALSHRGARANHGHARAWSGLTPHAQTARDCGDDQEGSSFGTSMRPSLHAAHKPKTHELLYSIPT